jgi:hypothetical protein
LRSRISHSGCAAPWPALMAGRLGAAWKHKARPRLKEKDRHALKAWGASSSEGRQAGSEQGDLKPRHVANDSKSKGRQGKPGMAIQQLVKNGQRTWPRAMAPISTAKNTEMTSPPVYGLPAFHKDRVQRVSAARQ